jgi:hypothetical protein
MRTPAAAMPRPYAEVEDLHPELRAAIEEALKG